MKLPKKGISSAPKIHLDALAYNLSCAYNLEQLANDLCGVINIRPTLLGTTMDKYVRKVFMHNPDGDGNAASPDNSM